MLIVLITTTPAFPNVHHMGTKTEYDHIYELTGING